MGIVGCNNRTKRSQGIFRPLSRIRTAQTADAQARDALGGGDVGGRGGGGGRSEKQQKFPTSLSSAGARKFSRIDPCAIEREKE